MLTLENITKAYGDQTRIAGTILDDVSFCVGPNEIVALVGPNGCGKTTLLNIIAGFEKPTSGFVRYSGLLSNQVRQGIVFQQTRESLFPWLTVREHLSSKNVVTNVKLAEKIGLGNHQDKYPYELSGGMAQLLAIGRAWAREPNLFLFDEPFSSLDYYTAAAVQLKFLELWETKPITTLMVTHTLEEAIFLADRVVILSPAPSQVVADIPVGLPRPRLLETQASTAFYDIKSAILRILSGFLICAPA